MTSISGGGFRGRGGSAADTEWLSDAVHALADLTDRVRHSEDCDRRALLRETTECLRLLVPFDGLGFFLVASDGLDFYPVFVDPERARRRIREEVDHHTRSGSFSRALFRTRMVQVPASRARSTTLLHPIATPDRVLGLFVGILPPGEGFVPWIAQRFLSVLFAQCAWGLEALDRAQGQTRSPGEDQAPAVEGPAGGRAEEPRGGPVGAKAPEEGRAGERRAPDGHLGEMKAEVWALLSGVWEEQVAALIAALEEGEGHDAAALALRLRGSLAVLELDRLAREALLVERFAREGELEDALARASGLEEKMRRALVSGLDAEAPPGGE